MSGVVYKRGRSGRKELMILILRGCREGRPDRKEDPSSAGLGVEAMGLAPSLCPPLRSSLGFNGECR